MRLTMSDKSMFDEGFSSRQTNRQGVTTKIFPFNPMNLFQKIIYPFFKDVL